LAAQRKPECKIDHLTGIRTDLDDKTMRPLYGKKALKQAARLRVNGALLRRRESGINFPAATGQALASKAAVTKREVWMRKNAVAIASYNKFVAEHCVYSEGSRSF
jgi:post-segregation antitoxin (ccd killing protein)